VNAEDVAREAQFREGFTLVDYAEVGLPVFRLTIEAVTTNTRSLPTIHEFAMRCMSLGERDEASIARMLGLKDEIVRGAVDTLVLDGLVARSSLVADLSTFALTTLGEERLENEAEEVVQEEMIVFDYDGIRRMPIRLAGENVMRAADLKSYGAVEVRPYPADAPALSDLAIPEVSRVIRRQGGEDFRRNLLALKRSVRRNNVFREAVALVFAADKGDEVQVAFSINGKLSESHERAFAEHGGPKKMGFLRMLAESADRRRLDRTFGKDALKALPDASRLRGIRKEEAEARAQIRSIEPALEISLGRKNAASAVAAMTTAKERLGVALEDLASFPIRPLASYEQNELLREAILHARGSLLITSAGLQSSILTQQMMRDIEKLARGKTSLKIASFLSPQSEARGGDHYDPLAAMTKLAQKTGMELVHTARSVFFFLVQDDELAVVSNRPFFGEMVRRSGFQRVEGYVSRDRTMVRTIREMAEVACRPKKNG